MERSIRAFMIIVHNVEPCIIQEALPNDDVRRRSLKHGAVVCSFVLPLRNFFLIFLTKFLFSQLTNTHP